MRAGVKTVLTTLATSLLLAGCANLHAVHRSERIGEYKEGSQIEFIDAKQRGILSSIRPIEMRDADGELISTERYRAFCAEPSPDVFSVLSEAMSASGSFGQGADPESVKAALQGAFSSAEAGTTIPRTQTINMLREMMYRTCERYISGAMSASQFATQAIRDQRIMVSILAIEQLTGAITPRPVAISATGSAGVGLSADTIARLDEAGKRLTTAKGNLKKANDELTALDEKDPKCSAIAEKLKAQPPVALSDDETKKQAECKAAKDKVDQAKDAKTDAQKIYDQLSAAIEGGGPANTSTQAGLLTGGAVGLDQAAAVPDIALAIREIVQRTFDQDEYLFFCLREMEEKDGKLADQCRLYAESLLMARSAELQKAAGDIKLQTLQLEVMQDSTLKQAQNDTTADREKVSRIVRHVSDGGVVSAERLRALLAKVDRALISQREADYIVGLASRPDDLAWYLLRLENRKRDLLFALSQ